MAKLNPNLIPHENFHKGYWLKNEYCPWFFFFESERDYTLPDNKKFYTTLDEDLKNLVFLFHSKKIPTTPSCSGHVKKVDDYINIFSSLVDTKNQIKYEGIELVNPETNKRFFYKNRNYSLPFSRDEFISQLMNYQKKGVLGFVDDGKIYEKLQRNFPSIKDDGITLVLTEGRTTKEIKKNWSDIEKFFRKIIK